MEQDGHLPDADRIDQRPRLSVFIATSVDGFIADADGGLDWLDAATDPDEDYGYEEFLAGVDGLGMGRNTYEYIEHLDPLPFGGRPLYVFTHGRQDPREGVTFWSRSPAEAVQEWSGLGLGHVYVDGGALISSFLAAGLIDDLTVTVVPVLLGSGSPLFHPRSVGAGLRLQGVRSWPSGVVSLRYCRG